MPIHARPGGRVLCALVLAIALGAPARATTFVRMDAGDLARASDAALIGTVQAVRDAAGATTEVIIAPQELVLGALPAGAVTLREPGGRRQRVFGAPRYRVGERVLVFVRRGGDGALRTTALAMGKYALSSGSDGAVQAVRDFGDEVLVLDPDGGLPRRGGAEAAEPLSVVLGRMGAQKAWKSAQRATRVVSFPHPRPLPAGEGGFTFLGEPSRWFEPDAGEAVRFGIDPGGDATLGPDVAWAAAAAALDAWSRTPGSALRLTGETLQDPLGFGGCDGDNRIVFNDPFDEIDDPVDCRGVLGVGGYCYLGETRGVNGVTFNRIGLGKVIIADGWGACPIWNACNLGEVVTHEVGHAIGLGHSPDEEATMAAAARFDGRCAGLGGDDLAGVRAIYPLAESPTPTPTFTAPPATETPSSPTRTARPPTPTPRPAGPRGVSGRVVYYGSGAGVAGVEVQLAGDATRQVVTGPSGQFTFGDVSAGTWGVAPRKQGDQAPGAISSLDAAWVLQAVAGVRPLDAERAVACDVTGNGSVTALDAQRILARSVGAIARFAAAETCDSDFVFFPAAAPASNQEAVAPALRLGACRAGALSYSPLIENAAAQDFHAALLGDCDGNWQPADPRTAEPPLAPPGTGLEVTGLRRQRGGRWRMTIGVHAPAATHSLALELRYDPARLTPGLARAVRLGDSALVEAQVTQPGRLAVALASALPLHADGRAVLVVDFSASAADVGARSVRPYNVLIDDRLVSPGA